MDGGLQNGIEIQGVNQLAIGKSGSDARNSVSGAQDRGLRWAAQASGQRRREPAFLRSHSSHATSDGVHKHSLRFMRYPKGQILVLCFNNEIREPLRKGFHTTPPKGIAY